MHEGRFGMADRQVTLETYRTEFSSDDKDANFKRDVATYSRLDPMPALDRMSRNLDIPVGALVRYVLARWTTSGSDALLEVGPLVVRQMGALIEKAEEAATDEARLEAYDGLRQIVSWLSIPLDNPNWQSPKSRGE